MLNVHYRHHAHFESGCLALDIGYHLISMGEGVGGDAAFGDRDRQFGMDRFTDDLSFIRQGTYLRFGHGEAYRESADIEDRAEGGTGQNGLTDRHVQPIDNTVAGSGEGTLFELLLRGFVE